MPALDQRPTGLGGSGGSGGSGGGRELAHAKLTRSLRVVGRRADGYHLLEAEMVSVDLADELVIGAVAEGGPGAGGGPGGEMTLEVVDAVVWQGGSEKGGERALPAAPAAPAVRSPAVRPPAVLPPVVPNGRGNLVTKALAMLGEHRAVRLTKRIPVGAGLGGGSSDAAAVLRFFGCSDPELAVRLGADVPFCVRGGRALVRGVGEQLTPLAFEPLTALLCTPAIGVSTALVYGAFDEIGGGAGSGRNDLEAAALAVEPELVCFRDLFTEVAGEPPSLAGSGSTWFLERAGPAAWRLRDELAAAIAEAGRRASLSVVHAVEPAAASS